MLKTLFDIICLSLTTGLYAWQLTLGRGLRGMVGSLTMQSFFLVWLYYLLTVLGIKKKGWLCRDTLFEVALVMQMFVTPGYWLLVHRQKVLAEGYSDSFIYWSIFLHSLPLVFLTMSQLIQPVAFRNRLLPLSLFVFCVGFPINYMYTIFDKPIYPPPLAYDNFFDGLKLTLICYCILAAFSTLLWALGKFLSPNQIKNQ